MRCPNCGQNIDIEDEPRLINDRLCTRKVRMTPDAWGGHVPDMSEGKYHYVWVNKDGDVVLDEHPHSPFPLYNRRLA